MEAEADNTDIDAARSIDNMLDDLESGDVEREGVDDERVDREIDTPLTPDMATRSQPPASSPVPFSPSTPFSPPSRQPPSRWQSTQSRQPRPRRQRQTRQSRRDLYWDSDSETETLSNNSDMDTDADADADADMADTGDADTGDAATKTVRRTRKTAPRTKTMANSTKTSTNTGQTLTASLSRPRPRRQGAVTNTPRKTGKTAQAVHIQPALDTEDIPLTALTTLTTMSPMGPVVARPLPAKAILAVQLKVNLEIEVVIKARICGDVLLSVL